MVINIVFFLSSFSVFMSLTLYNTVASELWFGEKVFPARIDIYETFNPGTIVKILACDIDPFTETVHSGRKARFAVVKYI